MTQKDFIRKFEQICQKNDFKFIEAKDWTYGVQMCYINNQDDEIVNEYVAEIGFDVDNDFYIKVDKQHRTITFSHIQHRF